MKALKTLKSNFPMQARGSNLLPFPMCHATTMSRVFWTLLGFDILSANVTSIVGVSGPGKERNYQEFAPPSYPWAPPPLFYPQTPMSQTYPPAPETDQGTRRLLAGLLQPFPNPHFTHEIPHQQRAYIGPQWWSCHTFNRAWPFDYDNSQTYHDLIISPIPIELLDSFLRLLKTKIHLVGMVLLGSIRDIEWNTCNFSSTK